jgi:hypothetical protein
VVKQQLVAEDHRNIAHESLELQKDIREQKLTDRQQACRQLFRLTKSTEDATYEWYKNRVEDRVEGTCNWFLQHPYFQDWLKQVAGPLLVSADPGCGKSVLAKYLVDHVLPKSATVCYFFFKDQDQNTACQALCALLHQLFSQKPHLIKHAMRQYNQDGKGLVNSTQSLWMILEAVVQDSQAGPVIIVLDALDECAEADLEALMRNIERQSSNTQSSRGMLRYLMTGRPYEQIVQRFRYLLERFSCIHIPGEDESETVSKEVNQVIKYRVEQLARRQQLTDDVQAGLLDALLKIEHRTYLWVYLVFEHLNSEGFKKTRLGIESATKTLPVNVNHAYEKILDKTKDQPAARKALTIIFAANRSLTLSELNVAMEVDLATRSKHELDLEEERDFKSRLRSLCGLFVSVHHGKVYFIHQTAREFLSADALMSARLPQVERWQHSITMQNAHKFLAERCVRYVSFFESAAKSITNKTSDYAVDAFFDYAAAWWPMHFREAKLSTTVSVRVMRGFA